MTDFDRAMIRIAAEQDQDIENAKAWMHEHDEDALIDFWLKLNRTYENPATELCTRFAIIGFIHVWQIMQQQPTKED